MQRGNLEDERKNLEDIDIWRSATAMIKRYGDDASAQASERAVQLLDEDDIDGQRTWKRIIRAIEEMQATEPNRGVH